VVATGVCAVTVGRRNRADAITMERTRRMGTTPF
jgi:hypothetical protein